MLINIVEIGHLLKIIQLEKVQETLTLTNCIIRELNDLSPQLYILEVRNCLEEYELCNADYTVFRLNSQIENICEELDNSIDSSELDKAFKAYTDSQDKVQAINNTTTAMNVKKKSLKQIIFPTTTSQSEVIRNSHYLQKPRPTDRKVYVMTSSISSDWISRLKSLVKLLKLKNVILSNDLYLANIFPNKNYSVIDMGYSSFRGVTCSSGYVTRYSSLQQGSKAILDKMSPELDAFELTEDDICLSDSILKDGIKSLTESCVISGTVYVTGGFANCDFFHDTKNYTALYFTDYINGILSNKDLPDCLLRYIETSILLGYQVSKGLMPYDLLTSKLIDRTTDEDDALLQSQIKLAKSLATVTTILAATTFFLPNTLTLVETNKLYNNPNIVQSGISLKDILSSDRLSKIRPSEDVSAKEEELLQLYEQAETKVKEYEALDNKTYQGAKLNRVLSDVSSNTEASIYSILRTSDNTLEYHIRGTIGDAPKLDVILKKVYTKVDYRIERIDDFNNFSIADIIFTVEEASK